MERTTLERISFKHLTGEVLKVLNLERGLSLTCKDLLLRPHKVLDTYLLKDRKHYTTPIQFSVLWVGIWAILLNVFVPFDKEGYQAGLIAGATDSKNLPDEEAQQISMLAMEYFHSYQNVINWMLIPLAALLTYLFYRRVKWHYPEHLVLNAYLIGMISFVSLFFLPLEYISRGVGLAVGMLISLIYGIWCYMDVFRQKNRAGLFRAILVSILYYSISFFIMSLIIAGIAGYIAEYGILENQ